MANPEPDLRVSRGPVNPTDAPMVVVVMAVDSDPRALTAVRSVLAQSVPTEIVLVNTGVGSLASVLPADFSRRIPWSRPAIDRIQGVRGISESRTRLLRLWRFWRLIALLHPTGCGLGYMRTKMGTIWCRRPCNPLLPPAIAFPAQAGRLTFSPI